MTRTPTKPRQSHRNRRWAARTRDGSHSRHSKRLASIAGRPLDSPSPVHRHRLGLKRSTSTRSASTLDYEIPVHDDLRPVSATAARPAACSIVLGTAHDRGLASAVRRTASRSSWIGRQAAHAQLLEHADAGQRDRRARMGPIRSYFSDPDRQPCVAAADPGQGMSESRAWTRKDPAWPIDARRSRRVRRLIEPRIARLGSAPPALEAAGTRLASWFGSAVLGAGAAASICRRRSADRWISPWSRIDVAGDFGTSARSKSSTSRSWSS